MTDYRVWPATNGPATDGGDPGAPINLGLIFQVSSTCWAKSILFYRGALSITGPVKGRIFVVGSETVLAGTSVNFTLSGTGWQTATLATPVQLAASTSYKVTIHSDDNYTATGHYWDVGAGVGGITNGPLVAPDAGGAPLGLGGIQQGSFRYTSDPDAYPNSYFGGGNYWVDLVVTDVDPGASHTGTGTAPVTFAASGAGAKRFAATASASVALAAGGAGARVGVGARSAGLGLAAGSAGTHRGAGTAAAPLTLAASRVGVHRGTGVGSAPLVLSAHGAVPARDITLTVGSLSTGWTVGSLAGCWTVGDLEV